jgi:hypothetical protein
MPTSDVHNARGDAKETVMAQLAHVNLPTNSSKQYDHDKMMKIVKIVKRVLNDTSTKKRTEKA